MAYAESIPSQDPNPTEDEIQAQAGQVFLRMSRGETAEQVAEALNISRRTVFNRAKLINALLPDIGSLRVITYGRSEYFLQRLNDRLNEEVSTADLIKGTGELRQLLDRQVSWFQQENGPTEPVEDDDELDEWVAEEAEANDRELREVRGA